MTTKPSAPTREAEQPDNARRRGPGQPDNAGRRRADQADEASHRRADQADEAGHRRADQADNAGRRRAGATSLPVVGVMGSGVRAHAELAAPLGRGLARMGVHLLTGGGGGVMACASRAFAEVGSRTGVVVGVLPGRVGGPVAGASSPSGYPNPFVELAVRTHLAALGADGDSAASRNHVNVLSSDVVVALPGGEGTASEVVLALRYGRPLVLLGDVGPARTLCRAQPKVWATESPAEALSLVRRALGPERAPGED